MLLSAVCSSVHGGGSIRSCDMALIPIKYHDRKWEGNGKGKGQREWRESASLAQAMPGPRMQCLTFALSWYRDGPRHITISYKNEFYK